MNDSHRNADIFQVATFGAARKPSWASYERRFTSLAEELRADRNQGRCIVATIIARAELRHRDDATARAFGA